MSNEEMKYLIKKELRKLYGEKASQYFKKDFLELISENLKETRKAIIKYETGKEADDFFSREFFQKYLKEVRFIMDEIDEFILKRLKEGTTQRQKAKELGVTEFTVSKRIKNMRERGIEILDTLSALRCYI